MIDSDSEDGLDGCALRVVLQRIIESDLDLFYDLSFEAGISFFDNKLSRLIDAP